ncbi:DUF6151 family protein [Bradyrhizobium sp.]|uniref:DUF6151 family protein n=1 Tax=Bradyrhizobium sp. TaxID=376 RepID=UPI00261E4613|nr:DUF6151 family protein [Bradyrhizobium sp.]
MSTRAEFRCRCGEVRGVVTDASPRTANRVVCYCGDCQAFVHKLGRADLLDAHAGSDIVQVAPASLAFVQGQDRIRGLRLASKGLYRWYASCCDTPVGNTLTPAVPFVGIFASAFDQGAQRADDVFGPPTGAIQGKHAVGGAPPGSTGIKLSLILRALGKIFSWRLRGKAWPHPFFARDRDAPIYPLDVLSRDEREALRAYCGPHPTAQA